MAIRDDFTAGEVLAAADLNDTFGSRIPYAYGTATPSTTVDGFVWYDENDTPPTAKFWDGSAFENIAPAGGLVHVNTTAFSAVSSVSFNDVFTNTYQNYLLTVECTLSTEAATNLRMRASASDNSNASYRQIGIYQDWSTTVNGNGATGLTQWNFGDQNGSLVIMFSVFSPQALARTRGYSNSIGETRAALNSHAFDSTTQFDGFTIFRSSGTFTGTVRIYGYQNS